MIIVDNLCLFSSLILLSQYKKNHRVYFLHSSPGILSRILIWILKRRGWSFHRLIGSLSACHGTSPYSELGEIMFWAMSESKKDFSKIIQTLDAISPYEKERLIAYFSKQAGIELYFGVQLCVFLTTQFSDRENIVEVLIRKTALSSLISPIYEKARFKVCFYPSFFFSTIFPRENYAMDKVIFDGQIMNLQQMRSVINTTIKFIVNALRCKVLFYCFSVNRLKIRSYKVCAMVFNDRLVDLNNCAPWAMPFAENLGDLKKETIAICPSFFKDGAKEYYRKISDHVLAYDYNFKFPLKNERLIKTMAFSLKFFLKNIYLYHKLWGPKAFPKAFIDPLKIWMLKYSFTLLTKLSFFEALFFVNGSKILWTMNENDSETQFAAMAMHRRGGVSLGTSWSQVSMPSWNIQKNSNDVFFAWGKRMVHIRTQMRDLNYCYVVAGYPGDTYFQAEREKAKRYRLDLMEKHQVNKILTFIDNRAANDILTARQHFLEVYEILLKWVEGNKKNFMVIKTKDMSNFEKIPELQQKIDPFIERGRLTVVNERSALYPGLASDVVFGISSTSLTSLLAVLGRPVIFYDPHWIFKRFPLEIPQARVIYTVEEIVPAIEDALEKESVQFYDAPIDTGTAIDPFVDGKAALRMKTYMENLLECYRKDYSQERALQYANEQFQKEWGRDYVISGILGC